MLFKGWKDRSKWIQRVTNAIISQVALLLNGVTNDYTSH